MTYEQTARSLLVGLKRIVCIHGEDAVDGTPGITILYDEGTSYFKPCTSADEREEIWNVLQRIEGRSFTIFDDMMFVLDEVRKVELLADEDGTPELIISFRNHKFLNDQSFMESDYTNLPQGYAALMERLIEYHERATQNSGWFIRNKSQH